VIYCNKNTCKNFASHFKYTLTIEQVPKQNFNSTVKSSDPNRTDHEDHIGTADSDNLKYTFYSAMSRPTGPTYGEFLPTTNGYVEGQQNNIEIVFTNTGKPVAPTDFRDTKSPFLWLFAAGLVLFAVAIIYNRRRTDDCE
jgi:hypothetical protein